MASQLPTLTLPGTDESVPRLGQGTWRMEKDDPDDCIQALRRGVELGATLVDTAEMYGSGAVERLVGQALDGLREQVFLVSKVLPRNASRQGTIEACQRSLDRLETDHLDLYLLHWPSSEPIEDTMAAFRELLEEGLTRYVGVSNFSLSEFQRAQQALGEEHRLVTDQVLYWLGARNAENELLGGLEENGVPLMAYSPLGQNGIPQPGTDRHEVLASVAKAHEATLPQVMIAWVLRHENVFTIPKTSSVAHLEENLGAIDIELSDEELSRIDEAYPAGDGTGIQML